MVAPPPGRGSSSRLRWLSGLGAFSVAAAGSAVLLGATLAIAHMALPLDIRVVGVAALVAGMSGFGLIGLKFRGSPWRVPRSWSRFGHVRYSAAFGAALGAAATKAPSAGFLPLALFALSRGPEPTVLLAFVIFGLARASTVVVLAWSAHRACEFVESTSLRWTVPVTSRVTVLESTLLMLVGGATIAAWF